MPGLFTCTAKTCWRSEFPLPAPVFSLSGGVEIEADDPSTKTRRSLVSNRHSASILPEAQPNPAPAPAQPGWHLAEFIRTCSHDNTSLSGVPLPNIASFQTLCTLFGAPASCADRTKVEGACCLETLSQSWVCRLTAVQPFAHNHEYLCETTCFPMFLPIVITWSKLNHQPWLPSFRETM